MRAFEFSRSALGISAAAALLAGCGGALRPAQGDIPPIATNGAAKNNKTFHYTGKEQTFKVPAGVTQLNVVAHGGEGAGFSVYPSSDTPGYPGRVHAIIPVHPGEKLYIFVGGSGAHGGFNGGGAGGHAYGTYTGNSGGGASDIRAGGDTLPDRIIVAAGGGGAGQAIYYYGHGYGGNGGGLTGQSGGGAGSSLSGGGGTGGTQSAGGSGGPGGSVPGYSRYDGKPGSDGTLGAGGNGGNGVSPFGSNFAGGGGGGGGGYYGGGGGGGGASAPYYSLYRAEDGGGGGGGSSYVESSATKSRMWTGWKAKGDGLVVFSWE
jgi:hypothetical protein